MGGSWEEDVLNWQKAKKKRQKKLCLLSKMKWMWPQKLKAVDPSMCFCSSNASDEPKKSKISKINATLSQNDAINNNQVVFLYCLCTLYTQRVRVDVYMYTTDSPKWDCLA